MLINDSVILRPLTGCREAFIRGINNEDLCYMYGISYPVDGSRLFDRFSGLSDAYGVFRTVDDALVGFVLSVEPELPEELRAELPAAGRTLAYATFPLFQRHGYMYNALHLLTEHLFADGIEYIHCGRFDYNEKCDFLLKKLGFRITGQHKFKDKSIIDEILLKRST